MWTAAALALAVALAVVATPRVVYGFLLGWRAQVASYRDWAIRALVLVFSVELVLAGAAGLAAAAWSGALAVAFSVARFTWVARRTTRLQAACKGLGDPATRDACLAVIDRDLSGRLRRALASTGHYRSYASAALVVGNAIADAGLLAKALAVVESIDASKLDPSLRAMRAQNLAVFLLRRGDRRAARATLAEIPRPVPDRRYEDALAAVDALLVAMEGDPREAEARARGGMRGAVDDGVAATWRGALAHALAAQGARDEAMLVLRDLVASHGPVALDRVARHLGPASPLAEALRAESAAPYR